MLESLSTVLDLLTRPDFQAGLIAGSIGLAVLFSLSRSDRSLPLWGLVFSAAALVAIDLTVGRHLSVTAGVGGLALGGWLIRDRAGAANVLAGWVLIVAGAVVIGVRGGLDDLDWLPWAAPVAILIAGWCLATWSKHLPHGLIGPMIVVAAFGIWVTVPETEHARALLGVAIPLAVATLSPINARLSTAGAFALAGVLVWVVAIGGDARPASIIGGWGCLGALAILPWVRPPAEGLVIRAPWKVFAGHAVFVLISARLIGLWESAVAATIALLALALVSLLIAGSLTGRSDSEMVGAHGPE